MANRTHTKDLIELWSLGTLLDEAAWIYASEYEKNKARNVKTLEASEAYQVLFRRGLLDKLLYGHLFAYGLRTGAPPSAGPEQIPRHLFRDPKVDWVESSLLSGGHQFEQIRVLEQQAIACPQDTGAPSSGEAERQPSADDPGKDAIENVGNKFEAGEVHVPDEFISPIIGKQALPTPKGRPSKNSEIENTIDALNSEGEDPSKLPRKVAYDRIRKKAETLGSNVEIGFSDPVIQRVLIKRYGRRS